VNYLDARPTCVFDTECYVNYWLIGFKCVSSGRKKLFDMQPGKPLDRAGVASILRKWRIVGFNSTKYDVPMLCLAMRQGTTNLDLKRASDELILTGIPHWKWMKRVNLEVPSFIDNIDLMEVNPGAAAKPSLKICGGRLHTRRMQDLPFEPSRVLSDEDIEQMRQYNVNDLDVTIDMYRELVPALTFRAQMSNRYKTDLRSKSDAQMAEAMIKIDAQRVLREQVYRPDIEPKVFTYRAPQWVCFESQDLKTMLDEVQRVQIVVDEHGQVQMPKYLAEKKIIIGNGVYRMGIGGLHSSEESVTHVSDEEGDLRDNDVASMYPNIILSTGLVPPALGNAFTAIYTSIVRGRLENKEKAKAIKAQMKTIDPGDDAYASLAAQFSMLETTQLGQKICANGSYGKLGSPYSILYAPELMVQVTLTGQLFLLMCIEAMERRGIPVLSANTDGFVSKVPKHLVGIYRSVLADMEMASDLVLEETRYRALHSRDVNNYFAITVDGSLKTKGAFAQAGPGQPGALGLKKNPSAEIASEAVGKFLKDGTPIEDTIDACDDVRKFVVVRRVTGGAHFDGTPIGKAIRWYYSNSRTGSLLYIKDNKTVPKSEHAVPIMELPEDFTVPPDLDRSFYIREAYAILQDVGWGTFDPKLAGKTGVFIGNLPTQKTIHFVDAKSGVALCEKGRKSIRQSWVEHAKLPLGQRVCGRCRKAHEL
jgi:hypothetical protein